MNEAAEAGASSPPALATKLAYMWGWVWGAGRVEQCGDLYVHENLPRWAYPRGGVTIGACFLTGEKPSEALLGHERVHVRQWARHGWVFPLLYVLAGADPASNRFEIEAGLAAGGYTTLPPRTIRRGLPKA